MLHQSSNRPAWIMLILQFNLNVSRAKVGHDFSIMFETDLFEILFNPCHECHLYYGLFRIHSDTMKKRQS